MKNSKKSIFSGMGIMAFSLVTQNTFAQPPAGSEHQKKDPLLRNC